ncbi:MAG: 23S rRNA (guanosine(2251)-2'-O)-methyltransferase RlmB [Alphaproteobacteria bacterium]|nr:23S rRNA (guanosine(2251)-2'-O)-methyltransferase RlmB [Alphaproteobacteria bacterium]
MGDDRRPKKSDGEKRGFGRDRDKGGKNFPPRKHAPKASPFARAQTTEASDAKKTGEKKNFKAGKPAQTPSRHGLMLWGVHAVREAWLNPRRQCFNLWLTEAGKSALAGTLAAAALDDMKRPSPVIVDRNELDRLLPPNSVHQGVALETAPLPEPLLHAVLKAAQQPDLLIVLDQVTDPHNVGAILRSAAAFGAGAVILTERNAPSTTGVLAKTASGAVEHVPLVHVINLARALIELQEAGYWCVGLAEEATRNLSEIDLSAKTALVLGAEGEGLRRLTREHCDELARLPTGGAIGSLNVSNAAAVALYEARKQKAKFG